MAVQASILLRHKRALGDTVCMTGLVRDVKLLHPELRIQVDTFFPELWANSGVQVAKPGQTPQGFKPVEISYRAGITRAGKGERLHMLRQFHRDFSEKTGLETWPTAPKGHLVLAGSELTPPVKGRYWVIMAGGKLDITNKHWWSASWQKTVDLLLERGVRCVQAGAKHSKHTHKPLERVLNMLGRTDARGFARLIKHADGVICPVTAAMHIAAVFDKPCVVVAGGREEPWWEHYSDEWGAFGEKAGRVPVPHRFLHTLGQLPCCESRGCWKKRVVPLDPDDVHPKQGAVDKLCRLPVSAKTESVARCMDMIQPEQVVEAVMSYYPDGVPPDPVFEELQIVPLAELSERLPPSPDKALVAKLQTPKKLAALDHPSVGGAFTVFVLCYGDHAALAKRCVDSIRNTLPPECLRLRIACNACSRETLDYVRSVGAEKVYVFEENRKKYPVMREMFRDPEAPIQTPYLVWFDDDAWCVNPLWAVKLAETIAANHTANHRMYGAVWRHDLQNHASPGHSPTDWFKNAPWWRHSPLKLRGSFKTAANGSIVEFVSGWFWAMATDMIQKADIPDRRLNHNGGDIAIGAQIAQAGFKIKLFNHEKSLVACPSKNAGGRRGYSEPFPWSKP